MWQFGQFSKIQSHIVDAEHYAYEKTYGYSYLILYLVTIIIKAFITTLYKNVNKPMDSHFEMTDHFIVIFFSCMCV